MSPLDSAMRWALVKFTVDLQRQTDEDRASACAENGWLMRDASGMFAEVIDLLKGLSTGSIDAEAYLEAERLEALEQA